MDSKIKTKVREAAMQYADTKSISSYDGFLAGFEFGWALACDEICEMEIESYREHYLPTDLAYHERMYAKVFGEEKMRERYEE